MTNNGSIGERSVNGQRNVQHRAVNASCKHSSEANAIRYYTANASSGQNDNEWNNNNSSKEVSKQNAFGGTNKRRIKRPFVCACIKSPQEEN